MKTSKLSLPEGALYASDKYFQFQAEGVAQAYMRPGNLAIWSTGIGKSSLAMMLSALLFEDDKIDLVLLVCESGKIKEWLADYQRFTKLTTVVYSNKPPAKRKELSKKLPHVVIGTYETFRNDSTRRVKGKARALENDFLTDALVGKRVLVVYDEMSAKMRRRSSTLYRHHEHMLKKLRKAAETRVLGLTATPLERTPENIFNVARLIDPGVMTVEAFENDHIKGFDHFGRPYGFKNLGENDHVDPDVKRLDEKFAHILLSKSKTDEDVRHEFPDQVESFSHVRMGPGQAKLYNLVCELAENEGGEHSDASIEMVLRQIAIYPEALALSDGHLAKQLTEVIGRDGLRAIGSAKMVSLLERLSVLIEHEGLKVILFTFFGQSVLPLVERDLIAAGYKVSSNHGSMSIGDRAKAQDSFKSGDAQIYLSSDAGSRGINLPEGDWIINIELPRLASTYDQRINRNHRISSEKGVVFAHSMITLQSIEESIAEGVLQRNAWFDSFSQASISRESSIHRMSAVERRIMLMNSRKSANQR